MPPQSSFTHSAVMAEVKKLMKFNFVTYIHPAVPIKAALPSIAYSTRQYCGRSSYDPYAESLAALSRQEANVARLYARRCLDMAAAALLNKKAIAQMEQAEMAEAHSKPPEWRGGQEEFDERKKKFGESVNQLGSTNLSRFWAAGSRLCHLAFLGAPMLALDNACYLMPNSTTLKEWKWDYACWAIETAGPTFIKLAQWASTRGDLFSAELCAELSKLQNRTRGHSWEETRRMLSESLGEDFNSTLLKVDEEMPVGSGCIAQVYSAKLLQPVGFMPAGTKVAVKVQHPHITHKVCVDFYILNAVADFLEWIPGFNLDYLSIKDSVNQFRGIMLPQLDFQCEARNLVRFRKAFLGDDYIEFPEPANEITTRTVLVEKFIEGTPILNYVSSNNCSISEKRHLATVGLEATMKMLFLYDFVHADLHPGNILINRNMEDKLVLNMIDCGLVVEMGEREHFNLVKILGAFVKQDGMLAGQLMVDTAKKCQASALDIELFCQGIHKIIVDDQENNFLEHVGDYITEICHLACKHRVKLESSFINASLACEIMEGIATKLYPDMLVQQVALPIVFKAEAMHGVNKYMPSIFK